MASRSELMLCAALLLLCPPRALGNKLQIMSIPAGATVELDGVASGVTPFRTPRKSLLTTNFWATLPRR